MNNNVILKCKNLCKTYESDKTKVEVIKNQTLDIYEKDFTVIMGNSGSGKSTLLYSLSGLDDVTSGEVYLNDMKISGLKEKMMHKLRREKIGFIFQSINLVPSLTVFDNVAVTGYLAQRDRKKVDKKAKELLNSMGLQEEMQRLPSHISGGQQQRVAIARALINSPNLIFADEPTGALNSKHGKMVLDVLTEINQNGQSIVMVTHDLRAACRGNRVLFLRDGIIDGELKLPKYEDDINRLKEREEKIIEFINERGW